MCRHGEFTDLSKSTANESQHGKSSRPSNYVQQRRRRTPVSKCSADTGTAGSGTHEEWETASEGSDMLKDSDSLPKSQLSAGDRHAGGSRQDVKRGYSNQRHTQSRRGRQRDHPSQDAGIANVATQPETGSGSSADVEARLADSASVAAVNSASNGGSRNAFPPSDPNGHNGNTHPVYRVDQVVFDDPSAIRTAFSDVFVRYVFFCTCHM